jgi:hypothetical protein
MECTIVKGSSRWSKRIYYLLYLESGLKSYHSATTHALEGSRGHEKTPDRKWARMATIVGWPGQGLCCPAPPYATSLWASGNFLPSLLRSHLRPFEVGLSNGGRGRSHKSMTWQLLGLYSTLGYIRMPTSSKGHTSTSPMLQSFKISSPNCSSVPLDGSHLVVA